jgi:Na+-transporting methylmalonyl-CoA/oxaloacetate decarboxylase gamma subunit
MAASSKDLEYDLNLLAMAPAKKGRSSIFCWGVFSEHASDLQAVKPQSSRQGGFESLPKHTYYPNSANTAVAGVEPKVIPNTYIPTKPFPFPKKKPFFRTAKGIAIVVIVLVIIVAAIVGGAVVGSAATPNHDQQVPVSNLTSANASGTQQASANTSFHLSSQY